MSGKVIVTYLQQLYVMPQLLPSACKAKSGVKHLVIMSVRPSVLSVYDQATAYLNGMLYFEHECKHK